MRKIWRVFCIVSIIAIATYPAFADCEQHDFGSSGIQYYIYSSGRTWNFTAGQDMTVATIETLSRLAGWYTLTITVSINGEQKASWSQSVTTTYTNYTHSQNVSFNLTAGDTITYKISGGTSSSPGGAITGPNYVKLCTQDLGGNISGTIYQSDGVTPLTGEGNISVRAYTTRCSPGTDVDMIFINSTNGTYALSGLPAGTYYLEADTYGTNYITEWWADPTSQGDCNNAQAVTVAAGATETEKDFQLDLGGSISGTIYQSDGVTPLTGEGNISVRAYTTRCSPGTDVDMIFINSTNGTYTLWGLPAGTYYLEADTYGTNYITEWWADQNSVADCNDAQALMVEAGQISSSKNFQLQQPTNSYLLWTR